MANRRASLRNGAASEPLRHSQTRLAQKLLTPYDASAPLNLEKGLALALGLGFTLAAQKEATRKRPQSREEAPKMGIR